MPFIFCPKCAGSLTKKSDKLLVCTSCGFEFYNNPKPVVNVIIENEKGEILLAKRKFPPKKGYWNLPGGFIELGESLEEGLAREIKEELHITLNKPRYFASYVDRYYYQRVNHYVLNAIFTDKLQNPRIVVGDDTSEAVFFKPQDISYDQVSAPSERQALQEYLQRSNL